MKTEHKLTVAAVVGTRPEAIKMAPLVKELASHREIQIHLISTGQHRSQLDQVFSRFDIRPDIDLELMGKASNLNELTGKVLQEMDPLLEKIDPRLLLVQGDTSTAFAGGLAAFHQRIPVGHVEAGLRSGDTDNPFPEEVNRKLISTFATLNFAPTQRAASRLLSEQVSPESVVVTGNTVVDALQSLSGRIDGLPPSVASLLGMGRRLVLVTAHRRESWGKPMENICAAVGELADRHDDLDFIFPVHKNPVVREIVYPALGGRKHVHLIEPLDYFDFISTMKYSSLILSDSGGVQEEAPTFGVPLLVLRNTTERPEVLDTPAAMLVGTDPRKILDNAEAMLLRDGVIGQTMDNPFGDGHAARYIVEAILRWHQGLPQQRQPHMTTVG